MQVAVFLSSALLLLSLVTANPTSPTAVSPTITTQKTTVVTTNSTPSDECSSHKDCDSCVAAPKCAFCNDEKVCRAVLSKGPFDVGKVCSSLFQASWATCAVNMMAMIIGVSVVGGVLIISCICCCCCCCCKNSARQKLKWMREDQANQRRSDERKSQFAERRAERKAKNDEIRKKYGLFKDGNSSGYRKFDNDS